MNELLELLEKHGVQMTGERHKGNLCCALRKGEGYCSFKFDETLSMKNYIAYFFVPAIAELNRFCNP